MIKTLFKSAIELGRLRSIFILGLSLTIGILLILTSIKIFFINENENTNKTGILLCFGIIMIGFGYINLWLTNRFKIYAFANGVATILPIILWSANIFNKFIFNK